MALISDFQDMPQLPLTEEQMHESAVDRLRAEQTRYNRTRLAEQVARNVGDLNDRQRVAYNTIAAAIDAVDQGAASMVPNGRAFFIDRPGGTGKTFVYNTLLARLCSRGGIVFAAASSGIVATLLQGGRTAHSLFRLPVDLSDTSVCHMSVQGPQAQIMREAKLIIWDEAPMMHQFVFEAVDRLLRDIMGAVDQS